MRSRNGVKAFCGVELDRHVRSSVSCGYLCQRESSERDERKSSGAVAWASGSPNFVGTWMQEEPKQCLCVGSTPTRVMRIDQTTGLDWS